MSSVNRKVLSFDLDGTLVQHDFSMTIWREAIPSLVARQQGVDIEQAKPWVYEQYESIGEESLAWYDLAYWYERFGLEEDWKDTLRRHRPLIRLFPEVTSVLESLKKTHRMIILSNASRPFVQAEMEESGIQGLFERVVSATSDLGEVKKTEDFYHRACGLLGLQPAEVVHVGDHWAFDYLAPRRAGISSYFLDREGRQNGPWVVPDLTAFASRLQDD